MMIRWYYLTSGSEAAGERLTSDGDSISFPRFNFESSLFSARQLAPLTGFGKS